MKSLRRLGGVLMTLVLVAVVAELVYMAAAGQVPAEKQTGMIGGAIFIGAVLLGAAFHRLRRNNPQLSSLAEEPHAILLLAPSPFDMKVLSLSFLLAAVGCGLMAFDATEEMENRIWAWVGVAMFASLPVLAFVKGRSASLKLSPEGLDFDGFRTGPIAWVDLRTATIKTMGRVRYIALELRDSQKYLARRPKSAWHFLERFWPSSAFTFTPPAVGIEPELILKAIQIRLSAFGQIGSTAA